MSKENIDIELFQVFSGNPKGCNLETIQCSHRYIANVIKGTEESPNKSVLIDIFNSFSKGKIKDYVYNRMKKSILLELALCILQEIAAGGPDRAINLQLQVDKTSSGGKQIIVAPDDDKNDEFPLSHSDESTFLEIDEASFSMLDAHGKSPEKTVVSGHGQKQPYSAPDEHGYFTPKKGQDKNAWNDNEIPPQASPAKKPDEEPRSAGSASLSEVA